MGISRAAHDPSVADYRATSPYEWGGKGYSALAPDCLMIGSQSA